MSAAAPRPVSSFYGEGATAAQPRHQQQQQQQGAPGGYHRDSWMSSSMADLPSAERGTSRQSVRYSSLGQYDDGGYFPRPHSTYSAYSLAPPTPGSHYSQQPLSPSAAAAAQQPALYADFNGVGAPIDWSNKRLSSSADIYASGAGGGSTSWPNTPGVANTPSGKRLSMAGGELVAAPELGKEWIADEAQKAKVVQDKSTINGPGLFKSIGREIKRTFEWKRFVFIIFFFCASLAAVLYFVIPRVPAFELALDNPFTSDDKEPTFTRIPAMFGWHAQLNVAVDGQSNWIPFHFTDFEAKFYDLQTGKEVGTGTMERRTFPGRATTPSVIDIDFFYRGRNDSDTTWLDFYNSCSHKYATVDRPGLDLSVVINMKIRGLVGTKRTGTTMKDLVCPIELPANQA